MAGCKVVHPGDAAIVVAPGHQLMPQQDQSALDVSRGIAASLGSSMALRPAGESSSADVIVDLREVYFLVMHFLAQGPCTRAFGQLWNELLQHKLLPRRYHARYSREGQPSGDENDDGLSFPLSYGDVANRNPNIPNSHLVDLLQQLLVNNSRSAAASDSHSKVVTAADAPTLLGSGTFSLLDGERCKRDGGVPRWNQHMRWPHWQADQVHGLTLRELGGGFARHHRAPSVRTANYVIAKPSIFFSRIQIIKKLRGHRNAVYCAIFDKNGQHVITGSDDRLVKIWSTDTGLCLRSCRGHEGDITDLAVSSSNKLVASASNDFSIRVWRLPDGFPVSVLRGHGGAVTAIKFSPRHGCEHHLLSSSDDGTCRIWDARDSSVNSRVYMPDPKDNQPVPRGASVQAPPVPPPGNQILCCAFNADGSIFVTGSSDKLARVWNATKWNDELTGRPNYELDTLQGHENDVNYVQFSGCAAPPRPLLTGSTGDELTMKFKNTWSAHDSIVTCSRDGSAIIWTPRPRRHHAKAGRWVKAYHLRVPPPPLPPQPPKPGGPRVRLLPTPRGVNMIVWSLDNRFVLAAIMDCRICVWNAVDGSLVHSLTGHDKQTYVLDVHPFNPRIAMSAGYDGRVIIWDIWDGHPIRVYDTGDFNLVDGNFSPDGSSLVVSDEVGQIYLFATGEGNSQKDAKYDQFFLGDFRPLVRDTHGNVLDQESQLPPHLRNVQDLLCDAGMIPYAEPYQTLYQQRRLGALGIDWQPPAVFYQIGTLDDPPYAGPPDPPVPFQPPVVPSPDRRERRASASEGGNRWVEQPNEADEGMDWEQEVVGLTEDSGSDYSASEEFEDDGEEKADTLDEVDSEEEEEDDEDEDEVRGDITIRLRRSSRNKRKTEMVTYSSSGRRLKRKRYDDGEDKIIGRRRLRRRKVKSSRRLSPSRRASPSRRSSPSRRIVASSSRQSTRHHAETSTRPKRQAARNALHLLSSINDDEEEEATPQAERKVADHVERASGSGEPQRVLRSRAREEPDEAPRLAITTVSRVESSDRGEYSRRPRSQRKLVVKLRSSTRRAELEDSKVEISEEPHAETPAGDQAVNSAVGPLLEDQVGPSETPVTHRPPRKLVIRHPKPSGGLKRNVAVIESSEDNHHGNGVGDEAHARRLGLSFDSDEDQLELDEGKSSQDGESWQWKKGKAAKRVRGGRLPEYQSDDSGSPNSGSSKEMQDEWKDDVEAPGKLIASPTNVVDVKDSAGDTWENVNVSRRPTDLRMNETNLSSEVEVSTVAMNGEPSLVEDEVREHEQDVPSSGEPGGVEPMEVSERPVSSHYSDEEKDSLVSVQKESSLPYLAGDPVEYDHNIEGEADNDVGIESRDQVAESMQLESTQPESMQPTDGDDVDSDVDNSRSELFEGNGICGRNYGESGDQESDDESFGEGKQRTRHTRQKALGELQQLYTRQESTSNRHDDMLDQPTKTRVRNINSVLNEGGRETRSRTGKSRAISVEPVEVPETRRKRSKDFQNPHQNGAGEPGLRTRQGSYQDGSSRSAGRETRRVTITHGSASEQEGQEGSVEFERRRVKLETFDEDISGRRPVMIRDRRTSGRSRREDVRREQLVEKDRGKPLEGSTGLHPKDGRSKKNRNKTVDRQKKDVSWLLLTEVEAGTRYIPQYGDDVVYLRQGHQGYLEKTQSEEKGPWRLIRLPIRAVEFCRIAHLEYSIAQETGQTCCMLTLKFTDQSSKVCGKSFKINLPELTDFPDFIVERSRYDGAMKKGWGPRDRGQVWWRSEDEVGGGKWWDGRVLRTTNKSPEYPDSPWDSLVVTYKLDNEPQIHSPWELFETGNHWHDPPHIDDESKSQLLSGIQDLEKSCYVGSEDEFGLRRLRQDVENPEYLNRIPLPLDLEIVKQRLEKDYYHSLEAFRHDIELLISNTQSYYGRESELTTKMLRLSQFFVDVMSYVEEPPSSDGGDNESDDDQSEDDQ
ncbi:unnamed protein product [Calypogeia fissa]